MKKIAVFASKVFTVSSNKINTFDDLELTSVLNTEQQDSDGKKPSTLIKDHGLDVMSYKVKLSLFNGVNPRDEYDDWMEIKNSATPHVFILGKKALGAKWLLKEVGLSGVVINNNGGWVECVLSLKFEEYSKQGKEKATSSKTKDKKGAVNIDFDLNKVAYNGGKPTGKG